MAAAADSGSYLWTIPTATALGNYKIKITSNQDVAINDSSNANFAIVARGSTDDNSYGRLTYEWKKGMTVLSTAAQFTSEFTVGVHTVELKVFDGQYDHTDTVQVTVTPAPNLIVQSIVVPDEAWTNRAFDLTWTVKNTGGGNATAPWTDRVYLSRDDMPGQDIELASFPYAAGLDADATVTRTQVIMIPRPNIVEREYRIRVVTDTIPSQIDEGPFENDNDTVSSLFDVHPVPLPDLIIQSIQDVPATAFPDELITVRYIVKNNGPGATDVPLWDERICLSVDTNPDEFDFSQVIRPNVAALAPGEQYSFTVNLRIPRDVTGSYNVAVKADVGSAVYEDDETNNTASVPIQINVPPTIPDLRVVQVSAPDDGFSGNPVSIGWRVENKGTATAFAIPNSITDKVWLSQDTTLDPGTDKLLGTYNRAGDLAVNEGYSHLNVSVNLPANIQGNWYLLVQTDTANSVFEHAAEANNVSFDANPIAVILSPAPDLIVQTVTPPANAQGGAVASISWTIKNQGGGDILGNWSDAVYLSADSVLDGNDALLAQVPHSGPLAAQGTYSETKDFYIPSGTAGSFYIIVQADCPVQFYGDLVDEFDPFIDAEANNTAAAGATIPITWTPPDLQVTAANAPASATAGQRIVVSFTVSNAGAGSTVAAGWQDGIYISSAATFDGNAVAMGQRGRRGALAAAANYSESLEVTVPLTLSAGSYYIYVKADDENAVLETANENNNALALNYGNLTENDLEAPLFRPSADFSKMRLKEDLNYNTDGEDVLGINFNGPAGILPPGAGGSIVYQMTSVSVQPAHSIHNAAQLTDGSTQAVNWPAIEAEVRPPNISNEKWNPTWTRFVQDCGPQFGGFVNVLQDAATTASLRGSYIYRMAELFPFALTAAYKKVFYNVTGRIYLKDKGHPLAGAFVSLVPATITGNEDKPRGAISEQDGTFRLFEVPAGTYSVEAGGHLVTSPAQVTVAGDPVSIDVIVSEGAVVTGSVKNAQLEPMPDFAVFAIHPDGTNYTALTDEQGLYRLSGLQPGSYRVTPDTGSLYAQQDAPTELPAANSKVTGVNFVLSPGAALSGPDHQQRGRRAAGRSVYHAAQRRLQRGHEHQCRRRLPAAEYSRRHVQAGSAACGIRAV